MNRFRDSKENERPSDYSISDNKIQDATITLNKLPDMTKIKEDYRRYQNEVANYKGDDPLSVWIRYVEWAENLLSSNVFDKSKIADIYRGCLSQCKNFKKYKTDDRFLTLFMKYARDYDKNGANMYNWMYKHDYGRKYSKLYLEYAKKLEEDNKIEEALVVLQHGHRENAEPIEPLVKYFGELKAKFKEAESESSKNCIEKFAFNYKLLTDPVTDQEYAYEFEEIRARAYYKIYEARNQAKLECQDEIAELKKQLAEAKAANACKSDIASHRLEKTRDSIMVTKSFKLQESNGMTTTIWNPEDFTTHNLTNVTRLSTCSFNNYEQQDMEDGDSDEEDTYKENKYEDEHHSLASRSMPQLAQQSRGLSILGDKSSVLEPESLSRRYDMLTRNNYDESIKPVEQTISLATVGVGNISTFYPSPTNRSMTVRTKEAEKMINKMFNQTDTTQIPSDLTDLQTTCTAKTPIMDSILIHKDKTLTDSDAKQVTQPTKDFSIFVDAQQNTTKKEDEFVLPEVKPLNKYANQDGSIFVYDEKTDKDIRLKMGAQRNHIVSNESRKPLGVLVDTDSIETIRINEVINFETTTSLTTKFSNFEPPMASTRSIKPLLNGLNEPGNGRLQTIIDDSFELNREMEDKGAEKEELLDAHFSKAVKSTNQVVAASSDKTLSKILDEDLTASATKWSNCIESSSKPNSQASAPENNVSVSSQPPTEAKTKRVKFNTSTSTQVFSQHTTSITVGGATKNIAAHMQWDDQFDYEEMNSNAQNSILDEIGASKLSFTKPVLAIETEEQIKAAEIEIDCNEVLTAEKLDQTFNHDYYRLYQMSMVNTPTVDVYKNVSKFLDYSKLGEMQKGEFNKMEEEEENLEKTVNITLSGESTKMGKLIDKVCDKTNMSVIEKEARAKETSMLVERVDQTLAETTMDMTTTLETTTTAPLNETIMNAIRDPFSFEIKNRLLRRGALDSLKKNVNYQGLMVNAPNIQPKTFVTLKGSMNYVVLKEIGKGAYAKIYAIESKEAKKSTLALKVDTQSTAWEFYITETLHERLIQMMESKKMSINVVDSFVRMKQFIKYNNGCLSAMNYYKNGSLLDLINWHVKKDESFPYWFVIYLTLEMLYIIDYLHKCKIIHADIKADNLLIDKLPDSIEYFDPSRTKCLVLIDFNRSIDLSMLPSEAEFNAKTDNKSLLCVEMKSNKNWTYQIDYFGILSSIHCIIFKKYMNTYSENGKNKISSSIPRNFDKFFSSLFDTYLNIPSCNEIPDLQTEFINKFVNLFKYELGTSFSKSKNYLADLNKDFN